MLGTWSISYCWPPLEAAYDDGDGPFHRGYGALRNPSGRHLIPEVKIPSLFVRAAKCRAVMLNDRQERCNLREEWVHRLIDV